MYIIMYFVLRRLLTALSRIFKRKRKLKRDSNAMRSKWYDQTFSSRLRFSFEEKHKDKQTLRSLADFPCLQSTKSYHA